MSNAIAIPRSRVGDRFFIFAAVILAVQLLTGAVAAAQFVWPSMLFNTLPFNVVRMLHINTLVVSLLAGFMGATYFLVAEESGGTLASERSGNWNFILFVVGIAAIVAGYLYEALSRKWSLWFSEGREYIEAPRWADWAIVIVALMFLGTIVHTLQSRKAWNDITAMLVAGLGGLAVFYLFGMRFFANIAIDMYFWWWVIHLWVEGVWELIAAALYALLLVRLYGFPRERAAKYVFLEAGLVLFTGILGTGHHFYWIGTPKYWMTVGGIFSALEPLPLIVMVFDALRFEKSSHGAEHPNYLARLWLVSSVVLHFFGAGLWGFVQTLPSWNRWTHGTQMTAAHGHLAFYGAYTMLVMSILYYALPRLRFGTDEYDQRRGITAFWLLTIGMIIMTASLTGAGILQVWLERMNGMPFMSVQVQLGLFYELRFIGGLLMLPGIVLVLMDIFALRPAEEPRAELIRQPV